MGDDEVNKDLQRAKTKRYLFIFSLRRPDAKGDKGKGIYPRAVSSRGCLAGAEARRAAVHVRTRLARVLANQALDAALGVVAETLLALRDGGWAHLNLRCVA